MKAKKILFVGGPSDGHRKEDRIPTLNTLLVACFPPWSGRAEDMCSPADATIVGTQTHAYHRRRFCDDDGTQYEAFVHDSIKNPMEALIKGYRYHRNKPSRRDRENKIWNKLKGTPPYSFSVVPNPSRYIIGSGNTYVKVDTCNDCD